jgi:hypothetical protein
VLAVTIAYFTSLRDAEVVDVDFVETAGRVVTIRLLVDSGFTGKESFVLSREALNMARASAKPAQAAGALTGMQSRGWVLCRIPSLAFEESLIAVFSDLAPLCLPASVEGMVGLTFLRHFARWGAERASGQSWRFFLESWERRAQ